MARLFAVSVRRFRPRSAFVSLSLLLVAALAPRALDAQAPRSVTTTVTPSDPGAVAVTTVGEAAAAYHPSRVLVRFRSGARAFLPGSGPARAFPGTPDLFLVENPPGLSVPEVVRGYQTNPSVLYAEPDYEVHAIDTTPNDPRFVDQWDMVKIAAPKAWDTQKDASNIVVAVIDTGIDFTHPDLQGNLWTDPSNSSVHGYTCMGGSCTTGGQDDHGHGTHVAGTIGAVPDNTIGIAGINWQIKIIAFKFLNSSGSGSTSDAVNAFNKIKDLKQSGVANIRVTSNSWGGGGFSQSLKDAMAQVESADIVNVCAAGNNGQNADANPMYPAAYDNLGIVSVLASTSTDTGASFTNYGLYSVDIAAPGVSTLSTVPTGTCSLCDPSGYKYLSGTSMATPHVSGVMAALMHLKPTLTARQARDIILDPGSYDWMTDPKAQSTSSGGRLNFYKTITNANPRFSTSPFGLNTFPTLTMGPDVFASAGGAVNLTATASDPDGDSTRMDWSKSVSTGSTWLFGWMANSLFPNPTGSSASFTAPSLARTATVPYDASVADNRGGGAHGRNYVTVAPASPPGTPPSGTLTVSNSAPPVGGTVTVSFTPTDPDNKGTPAWDMWAAGKNGSSGWCCFTGSSTNITFNSAGVYRIGTQAIDRYLDLSQRPSVVVRVGDATGEPPLASATLDKLSGPVPLTVNIDMSGSTDAEGPIKYYFMNCGGGGFTAGSSSPLGTCTYTTPGPYWLLLQVQDNAGQMDLLSAYVVATPVGGGGGGDTTPPTVSVTAPANGATVSGTNVTVSADASDNVGVVGVQFKLDGNNLGAEDTTAPYSVAWDTTTAANGPHSLTAVARDAAGNSTSSSAVNVTVNNPDTTPPTVSLTAPANGATVSGTNVTVSATASDNVGVVGVQFKLDGSNLGAEDLTAPYSVAWDTTTAANGSHTLTAVARDAAGNATTSASITVTVSNAILAPPVVSSMTPSDGSTVARKTTVTISATVAAGTYPISRVDFLVNSTVVCSDTTSSSYTCDWKVPAAVNKSYTLRANAYDTQGNVGSRTVTVTAK